MQTFTGTLSARFLASLETHSLLTESKALHCVYCLQCITADDDDAQRVTKREIAHTVCAFRVNDAFFAELDAENEDQEN